MANEDVRVLASIQANKLMISVLTSLIDKIVEDRKAHLDKVREITLNAIDQGDNRVLRLDLVPPHLHDSYKEALKSEVIGMMTG